MTNQNSITYMPPAPDRAFIAFSCTVQFACMHVAMFEYNKLKKKKKDAWFYANEVGRVAHGVDFSHNHGIRNGACTPHASLECLAWCSKAGFGPQSADFLGGAAPSTKAQFFCRTRHKTTRCRCWVCRFVLCTIFTTLVQYPST